MKEIVTIQLGNCGNSLGCQFWEEMCEEHGVLSSGRWCGEHDVQMQKINCMFNPGPRHNYVPRCVLIDLDPTSLESCRCSPIGQVFRPDNFIFGRVGAGNNFARGNFTGGMDIKDITSDAIRKEVELCDWLVGFQMIHAVGGGTGSGMGTLLMEMLKDDYPKNVMFNFTILPSPKVSDTVVEPINATLACPSLIKNSDITVCLDNERLYDVCTNILKLDSPLYQDLNQVMAKVMAGASATYRFPAKNHVGWRAMRCVMVPAPKLHFFIPGYVPLNSRGVQAYRSFSLQDITYQMLEGKVMLGDMRHNSGKYLSALALYRGFNVPDEQINDLISCHELKNPSHFVDWMPYHFLKGVCETPPKGMKISATLLANHTSSTGVWCRTLSRYQKMFKRKAFIHWYYQEGMGLDDFRQAEAEINDLICEYEQCELAPPPGWVSMSDNEVMNKCVEEEQMVKLVTDLPILERKLVVPYC